MPTYAVHTGHPKARGPVLYAEATSPKQALKIARAHGQKLTRNAYARRVSLAERIAGFRACGLIVNT
jgi:hypothetical protein